MNPILDSADFTVALNAAFAQIAELAPALLLAMGTIGAFMFGIRFVRRFVKGRV